MTDHRPPPDLSALCTRYLSGHGANADPMLLGQKSVELKVEATRLLKEAGLDDHGLTSGLQRLDEMIEATLFGKSTDPNVHRIDYDDGGVYVGTLKDDDPHGEGHVFYPDGDHYKGAFENGMPHGAGVMITANGDRREGNFRQGAFHGTGRLTQANAVKYEGQFQENAITGQGRIITEHSVLEGDFKGGIVQGVARLIYSDGNVYEGLFENNEPSDGVLMDASGSKTRVRLKNGKLHEIAPKKPKRKGSLITRILRDLREEYAGHPVYATLTVSLILFLTLSVAGVIPPVGSLLYIFDKHGEAAVQRASEEIASLPANAVQRATTMPVPDGAYTASALGPDIAAASTKVFTKIAAQCGASNGSILQTTTAQTARGTYADASFCCLGEDICRPPMPAIRPIKVQASIWLYMFEEHPGLTKLISHYANENLNPGWQPWDVFEFLSDESHWTHATPDPDAKVVWIDDALYQACFKDVHRYREDLDLVKVAKGRHTRVIQRTVWIYDYSEIIFEVVCNKRQLDHYGIRY